MKPAIIWVVAWGVVLGHIVIPVVLLWLVLAGFEKVFMTKTSTSKRNGSRT